MVDSTKRALSCPGEGKRLDEKGLSFQASKLLSNSAMSLQFSPIKAHFDSENRVRSQRSNSVSFFQDPVDDWSLSRKLREEDVETLPSISIEPFEDDVFDGSSTEGKNPDWNLTPTKSMISHVFFEKSNDCGLQKQNHLKQISVDQECFLENGIYSAGDAELKSCDRLHVPLNTTSSSIAEIKRLQGLNYHAVLFQKIVRYFSLQYFSCCKSCYMCNFYFYYGSATGLLQFKTYMNPLLATLLDICRLTEISEC